MDKTYWGGNGTHQDISTALLDLVPSEGPIKGRKNAALERFRKASNAYYDIFNNGGCNRPALIRAIFGLGISSYINRNGNLNWVEVTKIVEPIMDSIILAAAEEQGLRAPAL